MRAEESLSQMMQNASMYTEEQCVQIAKDRGVFVPESYASFTDRKVPTLRSLGDDEALKVRFVSAANACVFARAPYAHLDERMNLLEKLICMVRSHVPAPPRGMNKHQRKRFTAATLRGAERPGVKEISPREIVLDATALAVQRAVAAAKLGALGRAIRTLSEKSSLAPRNEETADALEKLHPPETAAPPDCPSDIHITVTVHMVRAVILTKMTRGSAPSLDGWTRELLVPLANDPVALKGLTLIIEDIVNGHITEWARDILTACELVPFRKPTGAIRPIAPESALMKLACLVALNMVLPAAEEKLAVEQFGVGRPGGPEAAVHRLRKGILASQADTAIDMTNAYNTIYRHKVLDALYGERAFSPIFRLAEILYGAPSDLFFYDDSGATLRRIKSSRGVRQGCVLAPLLFAWTLNGPLQALANETPKDSVTAYLDDVHVAAAWEVVKQPFGKFRDACAELGLEINSRKTEHLASGLESGYVGAVRKDFIRILGSVGGRDYSDSHSGVPVGNDVHARLLMTEFCNEVARSSDTLFKILAHPQMPTRIADKLLRVCVGPRMNFLLRSTPMELTDEACDIFDDMYGTCIRHILADSVFDDPASTCQLSMPSRLAGLCHRPCRRMHESAYRTSCPSDTPGHISKNQNELLEVKEDEVFLSQDFSCQQVITCLSACGPYASTFLRVNGDECVDEMPDEAYQAACLIRVFQDPIPGMKFTCNCNTYQHVEARDHAMCCPHTKGDARRWRHDEIKKAIALFLHECGYSPDVEPEDYDQASRKHPDILVRVGKFAYAIEVSVTHPIQGSLEVIQGAATRAGYAMDLRIAQKRKKYENLCAARKERLVVCAVETFGCVSEEFVKFAKRAAAQSHKGSFALESAVDRLFARVSVALHTGNLRVWRAYMRK